MQNQPQKKTPIRFAFITGFIALFPLIVSLFLLSLAWKAISGLSEPAGRLLAWSLKHALGDVPVPPWVGTAIGMLFFILFVYVLGWGILTVFGKRPITWMDALFARVPLVKYIYPHAKELSDFLFGKNKVRFQRVVAIEYPRKGIYSIGFVTNKGLPALSKKFDFSIVTVFVPTSPTPFTGWTVMVAEADVIPLETTVDEAVRYVVSCGVLLPGKPPPNGMVAVDPFLPPDQTQTPPPADP